MKMTADEASNLSPSDLRQAMRKGQWRQSTVGLARGHVQANLAVLPSDLAFDFLLFCQRNPKPCPIIEVTDPGDPIVKQVAAADLRSDLPRYRIYRDGELVQEPFDAADHWREDLVAFLLGCSLTFEEALYSAGVPLRHWESGRSLPMYRTSIACEPAGKFRGNMAVSMRPVPGSLVARAVLVASRFPLAHGAPVHVGDPATIGIEDLDEVYAGEPPSMQEGDIPVFTACGVTPQLIAGNAAPPLMITHYPEHMLVCDIRSDNLDFL